MNFTRSLRILAGYRVREFVNLFRFGGRRTAAWTIVILSVGALFVWFDYLFFAKLLRAIEVRLEFLAPYMFHQLVHTLFLSFFGLLALSSLTASVSGFYMSREIPFLVTAPVSPAAFITQRFALVFFQSAWMILVFGTPPFIAYARRLGLGGQFMAGWALVFVLLILIPVLAGSVLSMVLMRILPASRVSQAVSFAGLAAAAVVIILFRMSRPERLFMDVPQEEVMNFVDAMTVPESPWLPTSWATTAVVSLAGGRTAAYVLNLAVLGACAAVCAAVFFAAFRLLYYKGLASVDEGRVRRAGRGPGRVEALFSRADPILGSYLVKDVLIFIRDPSRWTQAFLLLALVVLYVYNAHFFPLGGLFYRNMVAFLNLAISGFVLSALCVRFVFPAVSLEGRSFWVTMSAPVPMRRFFLAKYLFAAVPLGVIAVVLNLATNLVMGVSGEMMVLLVAASLAMALALVGLNLGMGALYPRFDHENEAQIPASPGGVLTMILSLFYVGLMVVLLAAPVYHMFAYRLGLSALTRGDALFGLVGAGVLTLAVAVVPVGWGIRKVGS